MRTLFDAFSGWISNCLNAMTNAFAQSTKFLYIVRRYMASSSTVYPFWCMIFICFTMVDLPLSPEPIGGQPVSGLAGIYPVTVPNSKILHSLRSLRASASSLLSICALTRSSSFSDDIQEPIFAV